MAEFGGLCVDVIAACVLWDNHYMPNKRKKRRKVDEEGKKKKEGENTHAAARARETADTHAVVARAVLRLRRDAAVLLLSSSLSLSSLLLEPVLLPLLPSLSS